MSSFMNGRLRPVHSPSSSSNLYSVLPNSLPAGLLTIHRHCHPSSRQTSLPPQNRSDEEGSSRTSSPFSSKPIHRCNLVSIHTIGGFKHSGIGGISGGRFLRKKERNEEEEEWSEEEEEEESDGDVILDHCWTRVNLKDIQQPKLANKEKNCKDEEDLVVVVLALLLRKCHPSRRNRHSRHC
eukprot:3667897-Ditylum_brightwellii.AAC.1